MPKALTDTVAAEVRAELARRNISRSQAAAAMDMGRTALWARLRGDVPFSINELDELARFLDVPVARFLPTEAPTGGMR